MKKTLIKSEKFNLWYGDFQALIDIDLDIPENQVTAVVGPSGCGKSTFVRCINRLNDQINTVSTKGSIFIDGTDIYQYTADEVVGLRRSVGMVFQRPNPFPLSVFENVAFGLKTNPMVPDGQTIKKEVNKALQAVGLLEDLDGNLTRPGTSLSLEQQQRLCIARCLPTRPKILLMDEPCSALDPSDTDKVEELIRELKKDYTVVIVTHNLQQAGRISDQSVLFHLGKIIEAAPTADFFQNPKEKRTRDFITGRYG